MKSMTLVIVMSGLIAGCISIPEPTHRPINYGIFGDNPPVASSKIINAASDRTLAIILSDNTKQFVEYKQKWMAHYEKEKNSFLAPTELLDALKESEDPAFASQYIIKTLRKYFQNVTLIKSVADFDNKQGSVLAIIDIYEKTENHFASFDTWFEIKTAFYNNQQQYINTAESSYKETIPHSLDASTSQYNSTVLYHKVLIKALNIWESSLSKVVTAATPTFNYDNCIRQALAVKDKALKSQAMNSCEQEKKSTR